MLEYINLLHASRSDGPVPPTEPTSTTDFEREYPTSSASEQVEEPILSRSPTPSASSSSSCSEPLDGLALPGSNSSSGRYSSEHFHQLPPEPSSSSSTRSSPEPQSSS